MSRPRILSTCQHSPADTPPGLVDDLIVVGWHAFDTLRDDHPMRLDFMAALWRLEDSVDTGRSVDAALVSVIDFVGQVS